MGGSAGMKLEAIGLMKGLINMALNELGVPDESYPAPVANAVDFLRQALAAEEALTMVAGLED